jgi:hypothetical protein
MVWAAVIGPVVGLAVGGLAVWWWPRFRMTKPGQWRLWRYVGRAFTSSVVVAICAGAVVALIWLGDQASSGKQWWAEGASATALIALTVVLVTAGGRRYTASEAFSLTLAARTRLSAQEYAALSAADKSNVTVNDDADTRVVKDGAAVSLPIAKGALLTPEQFRDAGQDNNLKDKIDVTRGSFLHGLYTGADGRWSTSKVQPLLWTYAVLFGLLSLFLADEIGYSLTSGSFPDISFQEEYLLLLGGPFAAAVLARGIVTEKLANGDLTKTQASDDRSATAGLRDIISDDSGNTDLVDFQYFVFNLVALTVFFAEFIPHLERGFPSLPDFLVGLTSAAALTYVTKKAIDKSSPQVTNVVPSTVLPLDEVVIRGHYLAVDNELPIIKVQGRQAGSVRVTSTGDPSELSCQIPADVIAADTAVIDVQPAGTASSAQADVKIVLASITQVAPAPVPRAEVTLTITGTGFGGEPGAVTLGDKNVAVTSWSDSTVVGAVDASSLGGGSSPQLLVTRADAAAKPTGHIATAMVSIAS